MSSKAAREKEAKGPPGPPPEAVTGEVPEDLKAAGWELQEHAGDGSQFKMKNGKLRLATRPCATPFLAFGAARVMQAKEDKHKGAAPAEEVFEGPAPKGTVSSRFSRKLKVRLSAEGLQQKCIELDGACDKREEMERNFNLIHEQHKRDLKEQQAKVDALLHVVRHQYVEEEVECEERMVYEERRVVVVRLDTDRVVESREMKPEETQQRLVSI